MPRIESARHSVPASDSEREQMEAAFQAALGQLNPSAQFSRTARELARPVFDVGWIAGVRTGHTGSALADVPLPPHMFGVALAGLESSLSEEDSPRIGQLVSYHGSPKSYHGRYWVTRIDRELSSEGKETVLHRLSTYVRGRFRHELHWVHAKSITALAPQFQADRQAAR